MHAPLARDRLQQRAPVHVAGGGTCTRSAAGVAGCAIAASRNAIGECGRISTPPPTNRASAIAPRQNTCCRERIAVLRDVGGRRGQGCVGLAPGCSVRSAADEGHASHRQARCQRGRPCSVRSPRDWHQSSRSIEGRARGDEVLAAATPDDHLHLPARRLEAANDDRHLASAPGVGPRPPAGGTSGRAWALRRPGSGVESTPEPGCSRGRNCDARLTSVHWCDPAHSNSRFWLDSAGGSH